MEISNTSSDSAVLREIGERISRRRLRRNLTQGELARQAGVSKRTVLRLESGESTQMTSLVRILRTLGLLEDLDRSIPDSLVSPIEALRTKGRQRRRASPQSETEEGTGTWRWGDEEGGA